MKNKIRNPARQSDPVLRKKGDCRILTSCSPLFLSITSLKASSYLVLLNPVKETFLANLSSPYR